MHLKEQLPAELTLRIHRETRGSKPCHRHSDGPIQPRKQRTDGRRH